MAEPRLSLLLEDLSPVHLIDIGGVGMSAIAKVLLERGLRVSGSDMKDLPRLAALRALGARVEVGHDRANLREAATVVFSSATRPGNPELQAAGEAGLQILHRAQVLGMLMRDARGIAVSGTHGKTTTTSMIALVLQRAGLDPTFLIGGDLNEPGTNAHHGSGGWLVAEADESDGSFLWLSPEIAVVTNVEADHLDHYRDEDEILRTFLAWIESTAPGSTLVACADDPGAATIAAAAGRRVVTYGLGDAAEWSAERLEVSNGLQRARVRRGGSEVGMLRLGVPGPHNLRNALAALAVADLAGVGFTTAAEALAPFQGVQRRFQLRGVARGVRLVDDYAHNPTKVRAAIEAARETAPARVLAVFQPHLYSRTAHFAAAFGRALATADLVVVTDVYGAREDPWPGVTGKLIVDAVLRADPRRRVAYLPKRSDIVPYLASTARAGDLVMTIGAGDITMLADDILSSLEAGR